MWSTWSIFLWPSPSPWPSSSSTTWIGLSHLIHILRSKVSPWFHQLSKTKLGLSISPFLVIDDNLFTKIFNWNIFDSCYLSKHITMCKGYGQVHQPKLVVLALPTYVLRVWIRKLAHMHGLEVWESNSYQMMLRCKEWIFEAWYQSELPFEHHP